MSEFINTINNPKFDFNDISLIPQTISPINSRKEVSISDAMIFVSPMDSVVSVENHYNFYHEGYMAVCLPRGCHFEYDSLAFFSMSLEEFEFYVFDLEINREVKEYRFLLVDIANGHMEKLYNLTRRFLALNRDTQLMIGNIANPHSYRSFAELGVHYIRVGIGGGSACTTSANTGVHYPMASLIHECYQIKKQGNGLYKTKIIADGGFRNYDEIIKAFALGADGVMLGSILNKCLESCADTTLFGIKVNWCKEFLWKFKFFKKRMYKSYRGMSTKQVQAKWGRKELRTAEGIIKKNKVEYTVKQWRENFNDYLRSAMSYCGAGDLNQFRESNFIFISDNAFKRFHK